MSVAAVMSTKGRCLFTNPNLRGAAGPQCGPDTVNLVCNRSRYCFSVERLARHISRVRKQHPDAQTKGVPMDTVQDTRGRTPPKGIVLTAYQERRVQKRAAMEREQRGSVWARLAESDIPQEDIHQSVAYWKAQPSGVGDAVVKYVGGALMRGETYRKGWDAWTAPERQVLCRLVRAMERAPVRLTGTVYRGFTFKELGGQAVVKPGYTFDHPSLMSTTTSRLFALRWLRNNPCCVLVIRLDGNRVPSLALSGSQFEVVLPPVRVRVQNTRWMCPEDDLSEADLRALASKVVFPPQQFPRAFRSGRRVLLVECDVTPLSTNEACRLLGRQM